MDVGILAQQLFNGLMLGVIYAMIAVGFSLFFGVLDVIKFSHGDVVTVGAFSSLGAAGLAGGLVALPPVLALASGIAAAVTIGALAGGKKGAGVGAAAGGVGGLIYDLLTRDNKK